jgi:hypothetical protein
MALAFLIEIPNMTPEQGAVVLRELGLKDRPPSGQILHIEGPAEDGIYRVVDVWESAEVFQTFVQEQLGPAFARAGLTLPADMQPKAVWPVTAILK